MAELVYPPIIGVALGFFRALSLDVGVTGAEHFPDTGGAVVAINHVGYLDFIFAGYGARKHRPRRLVRFMAKHEVFAHKVSGPLMRGMKHIPVDRGAGAEAYLHAVDALKHGELVGVFPEATISRSFELKDFKSGAARMAQEAAVPVVPVIVWGSQRLMTKGRKRNFQRKVAVRIAVGEPIVVGADEDITTATTRIKDVMAELLSVTRETYPQQPAGDDDRWWLPVSMGGTAPTLDEANQMDRKELAEKSAARRAREQGAA